MSSSIILISIKFPKKYGATVALSTAFMFFLIAFGIASAGSQLMESWFGLETTFRAKFEATLAGSEKFSQELSSMTYEEALKSLPLTSVFKESLKTMYANGVEPGMTLGAFATEILAERATKMAFALSVGLIAGLIGYIAVAIIYVKLNLWGDMPNTGENIGGIFVRLPVSWAMRKIEPVELFRIGLATPISSAVQIVLCVGFFVIAHLLRQRKREGLTL